MPTTKIKWDWPTNRERAVGVKIKLEKAKDSAWFHNEATVSFVIGGEKYHGWMPDYAVNVEEKWLKAFIVGDYENDDWYVRIPDETIQSTEFLRIPVAEQNTIIQEGWW